jgi:hypothetical protein
MFDLVGGMACLIGGPLCLTIWLREGDLLSLVLFCFFIVSGLIFLVQYRQRQRVRRPT